MKKIFFVITTVILCFGVFASEDFNYGVETVSVYNTQFGKNVESVSDDFCFSLKPFIQKGCFTAQLQIDLYDNTRENPWGMNYPTELDAGNLFEIIEFASKYVSELSFKGDKFYFGFTNNTPIYFDHLCFSPEYNIGNGQNLSLLMYYNGSFLDSQFFIKNPAPSKLLQLGAKFDFSIIKDCLTLGLSTGSLLNFNGDTVSFETIEVGLWPQIDLTYKNDNGYGLKASLVVPCYYSSEDSFKFDNAFSAELKASVEKENFSASCSLFVDENELLYHNVGYGKTEDTPQRYKEGASSFGFAYDFDMNMNITKLAFSGVIPFDITDNAFELEYIDSGLTSDTFGLNVCLGNKHYVFGGLGFTGIIGAAMETIQNNPTFAAFMDSCSHEMYAGLGCDTEYLKAEGAFYFDNFRLDDIQAVFSVSLKADSILLKDR